MTYSFFGTCFEDYDFIEDCIRSIINQSIKANEIILIDASRDNGINQTLRSLIDESETSIIYKNLDLPRVKALNYAISLSSSDYLLRFDTRTRFAKEYAEEALKILQKENAKSLKIGCVGGRQSSIPANKSKNAIIASDLMDRAYIFGNPPYRRINYEGFANSVYLGCYPREILMNIKFREEISLISEDTQLCQDIKSSGFEIYKSRKIISKYICRDNILSFFKLFRTYGRCRARTIISTKTIHDRKKFIIILFIAFIFPILTFSLVGDNIFFAFTTIISIPFIYNIIHELINYGFNKVIYIPFLGLISQILWGIGFIETILFYQLTKNKKSNYLK